MRRELLARIATGQTLGRQKLLELVDRYRQMSWMQLRRIELASLTASNVVGDPADLARQLVADEQTAVVGAQLAWANDASELLEHCTKGSGI